MIYEDWAKSPIKLFLLMFLSKLIKINYKYIHYFDNSFDLIF